MRRRGAEAVDVVMPPNELAKASASASKHFFLMLLGMQADGGCTHLAFTDGSPSTATSILDAVAKAFLYEPAMEPTLHVRRSVHIQTLRSGATSYALPADRRPFRLMRKRLWEAEVQRQLPAALSKRPRWAAGAGSAATEGVGEEAEAEGGQWMGMWPILDPAALGAGAAVGDAPRWQAVVEGTSRGARGGEGTRHQPSATGVRFMLREQGGAGRALRAGVLTAVRARGHASRLAARAQRRVHGGRDLGRAGARGDAAERPGRGAAAAG